MDEMTKEIAELIRETDITERPELEEAARRALADYLAAYMAGVHEEAPQEAGRLPEKQERRDARHRIFDRDDTGSGSAPLWIHLALPGL